MIFLETLFEVLDCLFIPLYEMAIIMTNFLSALVQILITAIATCIGAYFAFRLERRKRQKENIRGKIASGNRALYLLNRQRTVLFRYKEQLLEPHKSDPVRWINIGAILPLEYSDLKFNINELEFLFYSRNPHLINDLLTVEDIFLEAIKCINNRSTIFFNEFQPKALAIGFKENMPLPEKWEEKLGYDLIQKLVTLTDQIYEHVKKGIGSAEKATKDLHDEMIRMFPNDHNRIIDIKYPEPEKLTDKILENSLIDTRSGSIHS